MVSLAPRHLVSVRSAPTICLSLGFTPGCLVLDSTLKGKPDVVVGGKQVSSQTEWALTFLCCNFPVSKTANQLQPGCCGKSGERESWGGRGEWKASWDSTH